MGGMCWAWHSPLTARS